MVRMMFECPTTGKPLTRVAVEDWVAEDPAMILAVHCPKCSQMHHFHRADAILELGAALERPPGRSPLTVA